MACAGGNIDRGVSRQTRLVGRVRAGSGTADGADAHACATNRTPATADRASTAAANQPAANQPAANQPAANQPAADGPTDAHSYRHAKGCHEYAIGHSHRRGYGHTNRYGYGDSDNTSAECYCWDYGYPRAHACACGTHAICHA